MELDKIIQDNEELLEELKTLMKLKNTKGKKNVLLGNRIFFPKEYSLVKIHLLTAVSFFVWKGFQKRTPENHGLFFSRNISSGFLLGGFLEKEGVP